MKAYYSDTIDQYDSRRNKREGVAKAPSRRRSVKLLVTGMTVKYRINR